MSQPSQGLVDTRADAIAYMRDRIRDSSSQILLAADVDTLSALEDQLAAATDRGVLVSIAVYDVVDGVPATLPIERMASIVRTIAAVPGHTLCSCDRQRGLIALTDLFGGAEGASGVTYDSPLLAHLANAWFMSHPWESGGEVYATDPVALPETFADFRRAVVHATLYLRSDRRIAVTATVRPTGGGPVETVTGQVVSTRQQYLYPKMSSFYGEASLLVRTDEGRVSVGDHDAYVEDYGADSVTLEYMDERA